jgi:streptogramin lyase
MHRFGLLIITLIYAFTLPAQQKLPGVEGWRIHASFGTNNDILLAENTVWVGSNQAMFNYNLQSREIEIVSRVNGLSDVTVRKMAYEPQTRSIIIVYEGANIDIIQNDVITNIPDIAKRIIVGEKRINNITIYNGRAYLACTFGVAVIDLRLKKIIDTYQEIGPGGAILNVRDVAFYNNRIYVATPTGIYSAPETGTNLSDFNSWSQLIPGNAEYLELFGNKLVTVIDSVVQTYDGSWINITGITNSRTYNMNVSAGKLLVSKPEALYTILPDWSVQPNYLIKGAVASLIAPDGLYYTLIDQQGMLIHNSNASQIDYYAPTGPQGSFAMRMAYHDGNMWFAGDAVNGLGVSGGWGPKYSGNKNYLLRNNTWKNFKGTSPFIDAAPDVMDVVVNTETGNAFFASFGTGIIEMNENGVVRNYDTTNSSLQNFNSGSSFRPLFVSGIDFDKNGNLWVANFGAVNPISVRTASGSWRSFPVPSNVNTAFGFLTCDDNGNKWITNTRGNGLIVFNENNLSDPNDDQLKVLNKEKQNGFLPSTLVFCVTKDQKGELWIGTDKGLAIISNPGNVFKPGADFDARQIVIKAGLIYSNFLDEEHVYCIRVDAANRKWIGTSNGVWLVSPDGYTVIRNFTTANSPLPGNVVYEIGIDNKTGEVFFSTEKGMASYMGTATDGGDVFENVNVYPNPVRPEYTGQIAITGLVNNAYVKITDVAGNMVYETKANGGMATWNGNTFAGTRAATGVYLIFAANEDGTQTHVAKLLFIR